MVAIGVVTLESAKFQSMPIPPPSAFTNNSRLFASQMFRIMLLGVDVATIMLVFTL
jgi:hypothetical protein